MKYFTRIFFIGCSLNIFFLQLKFSSAQSFASLNHKPDFVYSLNYKPNLAYWKSYGTDAVGYIKSPLKWKGDDFALATFVIGSAALMYANDDLIMSGIQQRKTETSKKISSVIEPLGRGYVILGGMGAVYAGGLISGNKKVQHAALQGIKAGAITSAFTGLTKLISQRARPYQNFGPYHWTPLQGNESRSFFSGHTSYAFCAATMIAGYSHKTWVDVAAYTIATAIAFSRVHDYEHWASDVVIGAACGITISHFIMKKSHW